MTCRPSLGSKRIAARAVAEQHAAQLGPLVLQREVGVARAVDLEVGDLALDPDRREPLLHDARELLRRAAETVSTARSGTGISDRRRPGGSAASKVLRMSMATVIGPTPPGTGVIAAATADDGIEVDVAGQLAGVEAVDADVDHPRARLHHVAGHHARPAGRHAQDVGAPRVAGEIAGPRVAHRDRGVAREQQLGERLADQARAADHHRLGAFQLGAVVIEDLQAARRGARHGGRRAGQQPAEIHRDAGRRRPSRARASR